MKYIFSLVRCSLFFLLLTCNAFITKAEGEIGVTVSPVKFTEEVNPGEERTLLVFFTNPTKSPQRIEFFVKDFIGKDGIPDFITPVEGGEASYSLRTWVEKQEPIVLAPAEKKEVRFTVKVPADAEPGAHYGGIEAKVSIEDPTKVSSVRGATHLLLFMNVRGDVVEKAELKGVQWDKENTTQNQVTFLVEIENQGTVHLIPEGTVQVFDEKGKQLEELSGEQVLRNALPLNEKKSVLLPGEKRMLSIPWQRGTFTGKGKAVVTFKKNETETQVKEIPFEVKEEVRFGEVKKQGSTLPLSWEVTMKNTGTLPVEAKTTLRIYSMFGKEISRVEGTQESLKPTEEKTGVFTWQGQETLGLFTAQLQVVYGEEGSTFEVSQSILLLPQVLWIVLSSLMVIIVIIGGFLLYNKRKKK